eukprot:212709_1
MEVFPKKVLGRISWGFVAVIDICVFSSMDFISAHLNCQRRNPESVHKFVFALVDLNVNGFDHNENSRFDIRILNKFNYLNRKHKKK